MARLRYNNQSGTLGAALTNSGTTITFAAAPNFATIAGSDTIPIELEPGSANFEIIYLSAYTAGATTGTITRAAEDGALWPAVAHANGVNWVHAPAAADLTTATPNSVIVAGGIAAGATTPLLINPASASGLLLDLQIAGVSQASVDFSGNSVFTGGLTAHAAAGINVDPLTGSQNAIITLFSRNAGVQQPYVLIYADIAGNANLLSSGNFTFLTPTFATTASISSTGLGTFAGLSIADAQDVTLATATGTKIGTATAQKLALHGATPVIQRAGAAQVAAATTSSTNVTPYGYTTAAQADAVITLLNEIRAALVEKGIIKGAA